MACYLLLEQWILANFYASASCGRYDKALTTYEQGLKLEPDSAEMREGRALTMQAINRENASGQIDPQRRAEALKDPEVQAILRDPIINKVLQDLQENPEAGQSALKDPNIMAKIDKLYQSGLLQVGSASGGQN
eukprot:gb/GEZN01021212.1/.p1 GENE.gb/GEZN01021212.1/~~gb/GEZN01021212.1/.p1  ORF type:complete len:134 (+),score=22.81 gb/GEZN01021212.1/:107-508(+)